MPINMSCPSCGKTLSAPDSAAGKKAKCPACGQVMIVPSEGIAGEMPSFPPPPPSTLAPRAERSAELGAWPQDDVALRSGAGNDWLDNLSAPAQMSPDAAGDMRRPCPECGEMIPASAGKCRFCGAIFDPRLRGAGRSSTGQSQNGL